MITVQTDLNNGIIDFRTIDGDKAINQAVDEACTVLKNEMPLFFNDGVDAINTVFKDGTQKVDIFISSLVDEVQKVPDVNSVEDVSYKVEGNVIKFYLNINKGTIINGQIFN